MVTELQGLESLFATMAKSSPDRPKLARRLADTYVELEAGAQQAAPQAAMPLAAKLAKIVAASRSAATKYYQILSSQYPGFCAAGHGSGCADEALYYGGYEMELAGDVNGARKSYLELLQGFPQSRLTALAYLAFGEMFFEEARPDPGRSSLSPSKRTSRCSKYPAPNDALGYAQYQLVGGCLRCAASGRGRRARSGRRSLWARNRPGRPRGRRARQRHPARAALSRDAGEPRGARGSSVDVGGSKRSTAVHLHGYAWRTPCPSAAAPPTEAGSTQKTCSPAGSRLARRSCSTLIHRGQPHGPGPGHLREAELRYAQKSRLQSLLVRRFGPELEVVPDPASEGTVSLHHRGHGRDGCHAVLDALDEDARAWVRLQLDLGPPSAEAPSPAPAARPSGRGRPPADEEGGPPSSEASPDSLLRRADDAVASYDFVRARDHQEHAVAVTGGAAEPAAALLMLLVETLGDDAGAVALQPSLSRSALAHPDVRALLALATARSG